MATQALTSNLTTYDARGNAVRVAETSALFVLLSVLATIGVIAYMLFLLDPAHRGDPLPSLMVIVAESILVFQALLSMWTILASGYEPRTFEYHDARRTLMPAAVEGDDTMYIDGRPLLIDVFITVYGVAAWNGLALWAEASGDDELLGRAEWLLSNEAAAARTLWLEPTDLPAGYAHTIVSISWGAKRDDATWFSAEPSAILGIQALPLGPVSLEYLAGDPARVAENVADAGDTAFTGPLGDDVQAYSALGSPDAASAAATAFAARTTFYDGWSKALALAWVAAVQARSG